ncbi:unnamed protein product, partial [Polarella glacialis]
RAPGIPFDLRGGLVLPSSNWPGPGFAVHLDKYWPGTGSSALPLSVLLSQNSSTSTSSGSLLLLASAALAVGLSGNSLPSRCEEAEHSGLPVHGEDERREVRMSILGGNWPQADPWVFFRRVLFCGC